LKLKSKHLLGLKDISPEEITYILDTAKNMKARILKCDKKSADLKGQTVITLFYENSTRTRLSFELAGKYLGADVANISASSSSVTKGETLIDTARTIDRMATNVVVIRHNMSGAPHLISRNIKSAVINAGDGMNEHPTQALLDMLTMIEKKGSLKGLRVAIIGDICHSRVARSNMWGLTKMGALVSVAGPPTLIPPYVESFGVKQAGSVKEAITGADVVMGLRIQLERQKSGMFPSLREYSSVFGINQENLKLADKDVFVMHPGPVNRGVEMTSDVIDGENSLIDEQVTSGVAVRMALLHIMTKG